MVGFPFPKLGVFIYLFLMFFLIQFRGKALSLYLSQDRLKLPYL